jgi:hypothetical protein
MTLRVTAFLVLVSCLAGCGGSDESDRADAVEQANRICRQWSDQVDGTPDPFEARDLVTARRRLARRERPAVRALRALRGLADRTRSPESVERFVSLHLAVLRVGRRELETRVLNNRGKATALQMKGLFSSVREQRRRLARAGRAAREFGADECAPSS